MKRDKVLESRKIFQGQIVRLRIDTIEKPNGEKVTREIVEHDECAVIVALDKEGKVLLVNQYRHAVGKNLLEIPAGSVNPDEDVTQAACRELQEETGYFPRSIRRLCSFYPVPGYGTEYMHLFLASDLVPDPLQAEDTDEIEISRVAISDIPGLITSGKICDAKSIAGLLSFTLYK